MELARRASVLQITAGPDDGQEHNRATKRDLWGLSDPETEGARARRIIDEDAEADDE